MAAQMSASFGKGDTALAVETMLCGVSSIKANPQVINRRPSTAKYAIRTWYGTRLPSVVNLAARSEGKRTPVNDKVGGEDARLRLTL